ncbi:hypothetical protein J6590_066654 [Homalodisca vitripennis]|nr:hypothetical protein J6590_066654 [Homalodisca vitripennis]
MHRQAVKDFLRHFYIEFAVQFYRITRIMLRKQWIAIIRIHSNPDAELLRRSSVTLGPRRIIVQFVNRQVRENLLAKCKKPDTNVYVNVHLTPFNKELLYQAKKLRYHG